jgi:hypothetical protein
VNIGWIWTDNLRPLLVELGLLAGYRFDDSDWIAVEYGIRPTDSEAGPWFDYPVGHIQVSIALEPGADEIASVRVEMATEAELEKVRWLGDLMRNWHLRGPSSN